MSRYLIVLGVLFWAGMASAGDSLCVGDECLFYEPAEEDLSNLWINTDDTAWFKMPECPPDFGPIKIEMPESWTAYRHIEVECGRVVYE
jgi:hypothetical protein